MSHHVTTRRLRLHLFTSYFKHTQQRSVPIRPLATDERPSAIGASSEGRTNDYERRVKQLGQLSEKHRWYPRIGEGSAVKVTSSIGDYYHKFALLENGTTDAEHTVILAGVLQQHHTIHG